MSAHVKRRLIVMSAMHTLHTHILHDDRKRKRWQVAVTVDAAASTVSMVVEEDRTTLAPGWWLKVVSVLHLVTMCLIMDTGQPVSVLRLVTMCLIMDTGQPQIR